MSYKKLHLYRDKIEEVIRLFAPEDAVVERNDESDKRVKYTVTFADPQVKPAMLVVDFNNDGTTTIEDCRGKNKEYAEHLAEHVVKSTQVSLYETDNLYFKSITDDQFALFVDYMSSCKATMTSIVVENGDKYTICGEYGDTMYATRYNDIGFVSAKRI